LLGFKRVIILKFFYIIDFFSSGQLGIGVGTPVKSSSPMAVLNTGVLNGKKILSLTSGYCVCVIAEDYNTYCWGINEFFFKKK
jgi:hypothetical protein